MPLDRDYNQVIQKIPFAFVCPDEITIGMEKTHSTFTPCWPCIQSFTEYKGKGDMQMPRTPSHPAVYW